jgi:hypothetical protein
MLVQYRYSRERQYRSKTLVRIPWPVFLVSLDAGFIGHGVCNGSTSLLSTCRLVALFDTNAPYYSCVSVAWSQLVHISRVQSNGSSSEVQPECRFLYKSQECSLCTSPPTASASTRRVVERPFLSYRKATANEYFCW